MANFKEAMEALRKADAAGNTEDAKRLAQIANKLRPQETIPMSTMGAINRGLWMGATAPFRGLTSLINVGLQEAGEATGLPLGAETPFGGLEHGAQALENLGIGYSDITKVPESKRPFAVGAETVGESVPFVAAPLAVPAKMAPKMLQTIFQSAQTQPGKYLTTEALLSLLSGTGAAGAEKLMPGNPYARLAGEVALPLTPSLVLLRSANLIKHHALNISRKFSRSGKEESVAGSLQESLLEMGEVPEDVARNLEQPTDISGERLFSGEKSGSPTLIALQQKYMKKDPKFNKEAKDAMTETLQTLNQATKNAIQAGDKEALRDLAMLRRNFFLDTLAAHLRNIEVTAEATTRRMMPRQAKSTSSSRVRSTLQKALTDARAAEREIWDKVPSNVELEPENIENTLEAYNSLRREFRILEEETLPSPIEAFIRRLNRFVEQGAEEAAPEMGSQLAKDAEAFMAGRAETPESEIVTTGDLKRFRSDLLKFQRNIRASRDPDWNLHDMLGNLADATLDDFATTGIGPELDEARAFSYQLNSLFNRGTVGKLLGFEAPGAGRRVEPELTLEKGLGAGKTQGAVASRQIEQAAGTQGLEGVQARSTMAEQEDFIKNLAEKTRDPVTGKVNQKSLENFRRDNAELLARFPRLRQATRDASTAAGLLKRREEFVAKQRKLFDQKSIFAQLINSEDPSRVVGKALRGANPVEDFTKIAALARRGGPDGLAGLRAATFDYIFDKGLKGDLLSAKEIKGILDKKPTTRSKSVRQILVDSGALTPVQSNNLNRVLDEMERIETALAEGQMIGDILDDPSMFEDLIARIIGANVGGSSLVGRTSGAQLVMAQAGSKAMRKLMNELPISSAQEIIKEAIREPRFMADLLTRGRNPAARARAEKQIEGWLWGAAIPQDDERRDIYHKGGVIKSNLPQLSANLDKMPDTQRENHLRQLYKHNPQTFNGLMEYLEKR